MKNNILLEKSFDFSLSIIDMYKYLIEEKREYVMARQLLKSGTSIGANARESSQAESRADFIHKLSISLKEAHECEYWIDLLTRANFLGNEKSLKAKKDLDEVISLLTRIIKTTKVRSKP